MVYFINQKLVLDISKTENYVATANHWIKGVNDRAFNFLSDLEYNWNYIKMLWDTVISIKNNFSRSEWFKSLTTVEVIYYTDDRIS